ncbi:hypothetical protein [Sulfitobacter sp. 1A13679]|uniref:hypothetical protein n=1 Tax=Sulfitobacter sp. 1A13679 TaxID=3368597 RepID=UPI0037473AFB
MKTALIAAVVALAMNFAYRSIVAIVTTERRDNCRVDGGMFVVSADRYMVCIDPRALITVRE